MMKDETHKRHNHLEPLFPINEREPSNGCIKWYCQCDCGNFTIVNGNNLRFNKVKSCGKCSAKKRR